MMKLCLNCGEKFKSVYDICPECDSLEIGCSHENNETIPVPGTDETVTICHDCGYEV